MSRHCMQIELDPHKVYRKDESSFHIQIFNWLVSCPRAEGYGSEYDFLSRTFNVEPDDQL